jgi:DNA-binding transcriptional MerR regulator
MGIATMVPIEVASEKTGVDTDEIRYLIERRAIKAVQNLNRHIMIPLSDLKRLERLSGLLGLEGQPIHQSEAARKYNLKQPSISNWRRSGLIRTVGKEGNRVLVNEADIALIRAAIDEIGLTPGQPMSYVMEQYRRD